MKEKKLSIMGTPYTVEYLEKVKKENQEEGIISEGLCDSSNRSIKVATKRPDGKDFPKEEIEKNFLHELFHAILDEGQYLEESSNEPMVEWLARCTRDLIRQKVL